MTTDRGPDVQRFGSAVLLQGSALRAVQFYYHIGVRKREAEMRRAATPYVRHILDEITAATRMEQDERQDDVAESPCPAEYAVDSAGAAEILGCTRRHVQRIARSLDGQRSRTGTSWVFDRRIVAAYRSGEDAAA
ncbi:hypothetical protein [Rhodococcus sp. UNC23MFCrub1.1]|uniref:hypothetical protein n=1 Tax=Rhodococcus sp. UNC23MFCrub1.1 TaxID=1449068 RepID=UPI0012DD6F52|nr:hypothetical protein [Rhodococcus sp. UNC23MFCrub1.1]